MFIWRGCVYYDVLSILNSANCAEERLQSLFVKLVSKEIVDLYGVLSSTNLWRAECVGIEIDVQSSGFECIWQNGHYIVYEWVTGLLPSLVDNPVWSLIWLSLGLCHRAKLSASSQR